MKSKYKIEHVKHPALGVLSINDYLTKTEKFKELGSQDVALVMLHTLEDLAKEENDYGLREECRKRINKYEYKLEDVRYDVEAGAAAPVNREPKRTGDEEKSTNSSIKLVGHKTFTFSIDGETPDMKNNRLAQARITLINGNFMSASEQQWKDLFSGHTTHEKIKWIGEKGHIVYFFQAIKDSIKNLTGFGLWEIVAAHFCWEYTYAKSKKTVKEDFDHVKLSQGKAKQDKMLDAAAFWFKPEKNPHFKSEEKEEDSPYTYNDPLTNSELESDAWSNDLDVPPEELIYPENEEDETDPYFRLSDDY